MVSEKKIFYEILEEEDADKDDENDDDDTDGRRIIPIALGLSAGGLKTKRRIAVGVHGECIWVLA